jgi:saccharopine dehydrogenase (NAD+, L-lysine-forming)
MRIGILRETKTPADRRVPLTPKQCRLIREEFPGISILVQPSRDRCYSDKEYRDEGIDLDEDLNNCDILMGVKEVSAAMLIPGKTYFFFSHTIKKQEHNKQLLKTILEKRIRLVDYEMLTDSKGVRIIGFGRWAGLVGTYNGIRALCTRNGIPGLIPPQDCSGLQEMMQRASDVELPPVRIALTGDGRVAGGSEEMLSSFRIRKVTVDTFLQNTVPNKAVYVQLDPEKYNRNKDGKQFDLQHFFRHPGAYDSLFSRFLGITDLLIMAAYWDPKAPVLFTANQMKDKNFSIRVIADITCDINGSVPSSLRTTTFADPYFDFNRFTAKEEKAFSNPGNITVMTIDNLPCGLPVEASEDFGHSLIRNIFPILIQGDNEQIIQRATIAEQGKLTEQFSYLGDWVSTA